MMIIILIVIIIIIIIVIIIKNNNNDNDNSNNNNDNDNDNSNEYSNHGMSPKCRRAVSVVVVVVSCSVRQLNTEGHPVCSSTVHRVRGFHVRPFSIVPPCRQPHRVFGGL